jgi:lipopolysaccharide/colanic/teichoic acid biosynthesis glycosyltransferase
MKLYARFFKRHIDIFFSLILLVLFFPFMLVIIFFQVLFYGKNIFYIDKRSGLNSKDFNLIKFRTMRDTLDIQGRRLSDNLRLTFTGKILRYLSLDELPNLLNVLVGHMSIIGPRPLPNRYLDSMSHNQSRRYLVRPGMTGLAQIRGRNKITWLEIIAYDLEYVAKISFLLDLKILIKTPKNLFSRKANQDLGEQSIDSYNPNFDQ